MRWYVLLLSAVLSASLVPRASASLVGDGVTFGMTAPETGGSFGPQNAVVGSGVEFQVGNVLDVDFGAFSVLFSSRSNWQGMHSFEMDLTDLDWIDPPGSVTDVTITVFTGPAASDYTMSFINNAITLVTPKFATPISAGQSWFRLDVQVSRTATVPEPSTLALCGLVLLAGLTPQVRRRLGMGARRSGQGRGLQPAAAEPAQRLA